MPVTAYPVDLVETEVTAPGIHAALGYWRSRIPAGRGVPPRERIDPVDMPRLLPKLLLLDVHRDPLRFTVRVAGTEIRELYHAELTGLTIGPDDGTGLSRDAHPRLACAATEAGPVFARNAVHWQQRDHVRYEVAHLPLGTDDRIEQILSVLERV